MGKGASDRMRKLEREPIYAITCDFCGREKLDPAGWRYFYISNPTRGQQMQVDMCIECWDKFPQSTQEMLEPPK